MANTEERVEDFRRGFRAAFAEVAVSIGCDYKSLYAGELWVEKVAAIEGERDELAGDLREARGKIYAVDQQLGWIISNADTYTKEALIDFIKQTHFAYFGDLAQSNPESSSFFGVDTHTDQPR